MIPTIRIGPSLPAGGVSEINLRFHATFINDIQEIVISASKTASEVKIEAAGEIGDPNLLLDQVCIL